MTINILSVISLEVKQRKRGHENENKNIYTNVKHMLKV